MGWNKGDGYGAQAQKQDKEKVEVTREKTRRRFLEHTAAFTDSVSSFSGNGLAEFLISLQDDVGDDLVELKAVQILCVKNVKEDQIYMAIAGVLCDGEELDHILARAAQARRD